MSVLYLMSSKSLWCYAMIWNPKEYKNFRLKVWKFRVTLFDENRLNTRRRRAFSINSLKDQFKAKFKECGRFFSRFTFFPFRLDCVFVWRLFSTKLRCKFCWHFLYWICFVTQFSNVFRFDFKRQTPKKAKIRLPSAIQAFFCQTEMRPKIFFVYFSDIKLAVYSISVYLQSCAFWNLYL